MATGAREDSVIGKRSFCPGNMRSSPGQCSEHVMQGYQPFWPDFIYLQEEAGVQMRALHGEVSRVGYAARPPDRRNTWQL